MKILHLACLENDSEILFGSEVCSSKWRASYDTYVLELWYLESGPAFAHAWVTYILTDTVHHYPNLSQVEAVKVGEAGADWETGGR